MALSTFINDILSGNKKSISRAISLIENNDPISSQMQKDIHKHVGNAYRIGITGPPGAGKSTLTNELTKYFINQKKTVGIIAIDPTSPFTGGAVLGDRVRMMGHSTEPDIFIRSMATRGKLGGLARASKDAITILEAAGKNIILVETVGVGQDEGFDALAEIVNRCFIRRVIIDPVLAINSVIENVPGDDVEIDVPGFPIGHHLPPEGHLLLDGHLLDCF